ncbi:MAG: thiolase family protein, partial [Nocardioidaceae bacterium]
VTGAYEHPYTRHPAETTTTAGLVADAVRGVLDDADIAFEDVDGLGVSSFSLAPDHAVDLAWRLGLRLRWIMQDPHGGASGINLLQHAVRAVESGDAMTVVVVAADHLDREAFGRLAATYNRATVESLAPLPHHGPNALFAMLTRRHMDATGLSESDYAQIPLAQRRWAARNPAAVYREPLDLAAYLASPIVASPLRRYDCVPVVTGADAVVVTSRPHRDAPRVEVRAIAASYNGVGQDGNGLETGLEAAAAGLWDASGFGPEEIDLACVYDDYPVMVLAQLTALRCVPGNDLERFLRQRLATDRWPLNPSGGQLSAGQAGAAGGMHGLVEAVRQLLGRVGQRQVRDAGRALVTGYGMVLYRFGSCANAVTLERGR